jgi:hypothetical protein
VRSTGRIWGYGTNFEQYQKPMTEPTRGIYALYTHTDGCFVPPDGEKQGASGAVLADRIVETADDPDRSIVSDVDPIRTVRSEGLCGCRIPRRLDGTTHPTSLGRGFQVPSSEQPGL